MHGVFWLQIIMPVLAVIFTLVIIVVVVVVYGKIRTTQSQTINQKSFEELADELKADNAFLKSELAAIRETLDSVNKMMKEVG